MKKKKRSKFIKKWDVAELLLALVLLGVILLLVISNVNIPKSSAGDSEVCYQWQVRGETTNYYTTGTLLGFCYSANSGLYKASNITGCRITYDNLRATMTVEKQDKNATVTYNCVRWVKVREVKQ